MTEPISGVKRMTEQLAGIKRMTEPISGVKRMTEQLAGIKRMTEPISGVKRMTEQLAGIKRMTEPISGVKRMTESLNAIKKMHNVYLDMLADIQIPTVTEEHKRQLETNYKVWGSMGWSVIPYAPAKLFHNAPENVLDADLIAHHYFNKENLADLFTQMQEQRIKKEDLHSAIYCFESKQYKACALLLFGIIDAKLIRLQPKADNERKRRDVGKRAVKQFELKFTEKGNTELFLFYILQFVALVECLGVFFADGQDFRDEPTVINRNFVGHGMNQRSVRRKDCIKLFLALYNLVYLLEII